MDLEDVVRFVGDLDDVVVQRPGPGDGSPEIAWGDVFVHHAPGGVPHGQPFATVVTKAYPDEPDEGAFDRSGAFRLNIAVGHGAADALVSAAGAPAEPDVWRAHPVYGELGWVCVVDPGPRTSGTARELLVAAHAAARARYERRQAVRRPDA